LFLSLAGPRLGEGPRWDLGPGVSSSKDDGKVRGLGHVEGLSIKWKGVRKVFKFINRRFGDDVWQLVENFVSRIEGLEMEDLKQSQEEEEEEEEDQDSTTVRKLKADVARLEEENAGLRRRCGALLEQALEGSEHGDVSFRFEDGKTPFTGHRAVLCAASEEYAGMFRSGMVEGQEGIIQVPPGVSEAGYRGLLEWVYLGESTSP